MVSPSQVRGSVTPLASIHTFKGTRVLLRDSRSLCARDIYIARLCIVEEREREMVRRKSGPGAKRAVWHALFGKQRNGSSQVEAKRLGSSRANVVARKQVWLQ